MVNLYHTGQVTPAPMEATVEISPGRVSQLDHQLPVAGEAGLVVKPIPGAPPQRSTEPCAQLPNFFARGAEDDGLAGAVWTRARVG